MSKEKKEFLEMLASCLTIAIGLKEIAEIA